MITSSLFSARYYPQGSTFDISANSLFSEKEQIFTALAFMCSFVAKKFLEILCPTLNFSPGDISKVPFSDNLIGDQKDVIIDYSKECISISKEIFQ